MPRPTVFPNIPGQCAVCRIWSARHVCADCLQRYASPVPRCLTCAVQLPKAGMQCGKCLNNPPPLRRTIAALDYGFPWDGLLQGFKFHQAVELRDTLLDCMELSLDQTEAPDWLLAVPLTVQRQRERGYNQSHELACGLARRRGLRCDGELLLRVRDTPQHQAQLALKDRAANVKGVFAIEPRRIAEIKGRHVALLDDVMTSGATLFELAHVVRHAGAASVQAWVIARTPDP